MELTITNNASEQLRDAIQHIGELTDNAWRVVDHTKSQAENEQALADQADKVSKYRDSLLLAIDTMVRIGGTLTASDAPARENRNWSFGLQSATGLYVGIIFTAEKKTDSLSISEKRTPYGEWSCHS